MGGPLDHGEFIALLEQRGELRRVEVEVDADLEIATITDRVVKNGGGPALLFGRVKGSSFPVATHLYGSRKRIEIALGGEPLSVMADRLARNLSMGQGRAATRLEQVVQSRPSQSQRHVRRACLDIHERPDLTRLPALRNWSLDGGRFLTLPLVFTRAPDCERCNCGMYRMQIFDERRAGLHWSPGTGGAKHHAAWSRIGQPMPVAVALGGPPALTYAATAPLPESVEETAFTEWILGESLHTFRSEGGLEVPAAADFLLEGYVEPHETGIEGPFGNHTGYYAPAGPAPIFHLRRLTRRQSPVLPCTVVGPPPTENLQFAHTTAELFLPYLRCDFPEITSLKFLEEGAFHGCALIGVKTGASGKEILHHLWGESFLSASRLLVVVDADTDLQSGSRLLWRIVNQVDPERDVVQCQGRLGLDATEKGGRIRIGPDHELLRKVDERWGEYDIDSSGAAGT